MKKMHEDFKTSATAFVTSCCDDTKPKGAAPVGGLFDGGLMEVIRGLKAAGLSIGDIVKWIQVAVVLFTTVGPKIQEIIDLIRNAFTAGKNPEDLVVVNLG